MFVPTVNTTHPAGQQKMDGIIEIDPEGDVILQLNTVEMLVSSKVLSMASPVFSRMLAGGFKESVKDFSSAGGKQKVLLPEDDQTSFVFLIKVLHHRPDMVTPPASYVLELANISDKYQCSSGVVVFIEKCILYHLRLKVIGMKDLPGFLLASYICDSPQLFKIVSTHILNDFRTEGLGRNTRDAWYKQMDHPLLRHDLPTEFELKRESMERDINLFYEVIFSNLRKCTCRNAKGRGRRAIEMLYDQKLMHSDMSKLPIKTVIDRAKTLKSLCEGHNFYCHVYRHRNSLDACITILEMEKTLCLDCIKSSRLTIKRCRVSHDIEE